MVNEIHDNYSKCPRTCAKIKQLFSLEQPYDGVFIVFELNRSSQNQLSVPSLGQEAGSSQSQPPRKSRKRGIAALLADVTNQPQSSGRRLCKDETVVKVSSAMLPDLEPRGDAVKGGKARSKPLKRTGKSSR